MQRLHVGFDERCGLCMRCARVVAWIDRGRRVVVDSAQVPRHEKLRAVKVEERMMEMVGWDEGKMKYVRGFEAVRAVVERLPGGVLGKPVMWVLEKTGWGESMYRKVAAGRRCGV